MKTLPQLAVITFLLLDSSFSLQAGARSSASYSIPADAADAGGKRTSSASYTNTGSAGLPSGSATGPAGAITLESGYVAQLLDSPLQILRAGSRKTHGNAGAFEINLPLTAPAGIECRTGGAGGNHQVVVVFADPVSVGGLSIMSRDGMASGTRSTNGATVTIDLTAVADAQTLAISLLNVNNGSTTGDVVIQMGVLLGDTNGDGFVNSGDALQTRNRSGQSTGASNFRSDVNIDGSVNSGDTQVLRARSGSALP